VTRGQNDSMNIFKIEKSLKVIAVRKFQSELLCIYPSHPFKDQRTLFYCMNQKSLLYEKW